MSEPLDVAAAAGTPSTQASTLRISFCAAKGGQGCTTTALAAAVLLSRRHTVDLTAHDPDEAGILAGRHIGFSDDIIAITPRLRLVADPHLADAAIVVHDAGTSLHLGDAPLTTNPTYLVTRPCFLALNRAVKHPDRPDGIILIDEPQRAIQPRDIETIIGRPVVATVPYTPTIARAVDAARLPVHLPAVFQRSLGPFIDSLTGHQPAATRPPASLQRDL